MKEKPWPIPKFRLETVVSNCFVTVVGAGGMVMSETSKYSRSVCRWNPMVSGI